MEQLYNVILFGLHEEKDIKEVAQALSISFSISQDKAEALLNTPSGTVIKKSVTAEVAKKYQTLLTNAGAKVNYRPSTDSANKLSLSPIEKAKTTCPACGQMLEHEEGEAHPAVCPYCKVVIAKYEENKRREEEEKKVREHLKHVNALHQEAEDRKRQQEEDEARKKALEERIRKELGLPAAINTRSRLISSAALTLFMGVGAGILISQLFLAEPEKLPPTEMLVGIETLPDAINLENLTGAIPQQMAALGAQTAPGAMAEDQLAALSQAIVQQTATAAPEPILASKGASQPEALSQPIDQPKQAHTAATNSLGDTVNAAPSQPADDEANETTSALALSQALGESPNDLEWDAYLLEQVQASVDLDQLKRSQQLAIKIQHPSKRYQALLDTVLGYQRLGQADEADALLNRILDEIAAIPSIVPRLELATELVPALVAAGQSTLAASLLKRAQSWLEAQDSAAVLAQAWPRLAWAQAWLRQPESARHSIAQAIAALDQPLSEQVRVQALSQLGKAFAQLGAMDQAEQILGQANELTEAIEQTAPRHAALEHLALAWAEIGDLERAVAINQAFSSTTDRDLFLMTLLQQQALAGHSFGLPSLAEMISSPAVQARAYAMLGRTSTSPLIADTHFQHAIAISDRLNEPLATPLLLGVIARFQSRTNDQASAALFVRAKEALRQGDLTEAELDIGWANLAANAARAGYIMLADHYLERIMKANVVAATREDLESVRQIIAIIPERKIGS